ncbi:Fe-S cluster assembly ATPase SufC [Patescibacteria group bacterium]|nr:Fe-S cluster assembly ATPase SufC [Patescibacteria group bacterium]
MLTIKDLSASIEGNEILRSLQLKIKTGERAALMGPNGSGKSTLAHVLAGHPAYTVSSGTVTLDRRNLLNLPPEGRAAGGLFLAFQYPMSIPGVSVVHFLHLALNAQEKARGIQPTPLAPFLRQLRIEMKELGIDPSFAQRSVNDGFSGGEKKRLEILQMRMLRPKVVVLDEIDSGLDIDAIRVVASAINREDMRDTTVIIITHYQRLLHHIRPDTVHIMKAGTIVRSGGPNLVSELERTGYGPF